MTKIKVNVKIVLIITLVFLFLAACTSKIDEKRYSDLEELDMNSIDAIINTETLSSFLNGHFDLQHVVLFSRDSCINCVESKPILEKVFLDLPEDKFHISYFDTDNNREDNNFNELLDEIGIRTVPSILVINHKNTNIKLIDNIKVLMDIDKLVEEILMDE